MRVRVRGVLFEVSNAIALEGNITALDGHQGQGMFGLGNEFGETGEDLAHACVVNAHETAAAGCVLGVVIMNGVVTMGVVVLFSWLDLIEGVGCIENCRAGNSVAGGACLGGKCKLGEAERLGLDEGSSCEDGR